MWNVFIITNVFTNEMPDNSTKRWWKIYANVGFSTSMDLVWTLYKKLPKNKW